MPFEVLDADDKVLELFPLHVWGLCVTGEMDLLDALNTGEAIKVNCIDWSLSTGDGITNSSYAAEVMAYDKGVQGSEVVKEIWEEATCGAGKLREKEEIDLIDSTSTIDRMLARTIRTEPDVKLFRALARARKVYQNGKRQLIHFSDHLNVLDLLSKSQPSSGEKMGRFHQFMEGRLEWKVKGDKKFNGGLGTWRGVEERKL